MVRKVPLRFRKIWMDQSCYATVSIMSVLSFLSWYHFHCVFQCGMCVFTRGQVGLGNAKPLCQYALMPGIYLYQCGQTKEDTRTSFTRRGPSTSCLVHFSFWWLHLYQDVQVTKPSCTRQFFTQRQVITHFDANCFRGELMTIWTTRQTLFTFRVDKNYFLAQVYLVEAQNTAHP